LGLQIRREHFRHAREALLAERGDLTLHLPFRVQARPGLVVPGTKYHLVDQRTGRLHPLKIGLNRIGRLRDDDIVFEEIYISRRHCVILVHARGWCGLHDTASLNGTFRNGQRIRRPVRLASGDCIRVYDRPLLFLSEEEDPTARENAEPVTMFG
jgi:pSer/pThr/pTyr-binding forkhead associated (FHA) protein